LDQGGNWQVWTSTNDGGSWTYQGRSNLGTEYTKVKIVTATKNETTGFWDFFWHDRDTEYITASLNNDPADFFGGAIFNPPQIIHHNPTAVIEGGLGYVTSEFLNDGQNRFYVFAKEVSSTKYIASGSSVNLSSFRFVGQRIQFSSLIGGITYYFRARATNNFGSSIYSTISFTTTP
jgi:hypothetical protein